MSKYDYHNIIDITEAEGVWTADVTLNKSLDEEKLYKISTPSQTMLLETLRMLIRGKK